MKNEIGLEPNKDGKERKQKEEKTILPICFRPVEEFVINGKYKQKKEREKLVIVIGLKPVKKW